MTDKVELKNVSPTCGNTVLPAVVGSQTKYQIIYADPAWDFGNRMYSSNKNDHHREIERAYSVMKTKDICELPIKNITAAVWAVGGLNAPPYQFSTNLINSTNERITR